MTTPRWCIVGPTYPFRGGISRHTTLLATAVAGSGIQLGMTTFTRQYPGWLYKGASDREPDGVAPTAFTPSYRLDSINPRSWWTTARAIEAADPDVVVVIWWHPFFAPMVGTLLRRVRRRIPAATRLALCHNVLPHEGTPVDRMLVRLALRPTDGLVVHAASQETVARELLGDTPVLVTPHPTYRIDVAEATADPSETPVDDAEPVTLLFFGLIRHYKGLDTLLQALPVVLRRRPIRLVVAGEFWDPVDPYRDMARQLEIEDHVDIRPGYVPEAELTSLLGAADLVVAPYRSATQSGAVEMAFGAGVPVVASRVGGLADQVQHDTNGLLVPPDDTDALARALLEATEPETLARLTKGARSDGTVRTWEALVDDIRRFSATVRG